MRQQFGGDWTEQKLNAVTAYLRAYLTVLKRKPYRKIYVDAFAGTGYRELREEVSLGKTDLVPETGDQARRFMQGSARRALELDMPFDRYMLIEKDPDKYSELGRLASEHPGRPVVTYNEDANVVLGRLVRGTDWTRSRALVFLDPFGMQVDWVTVEMLAHTRAVDLWYLFPIGAVTRLLTKTGRIASGWSQRLDRVFGTHDWQAAFYRPTGQTTLFGEEEVYRDPGIQAILRFFVDRLGGVFAGVAANPLVLRNSIGAPMFVLAFATANPYAKAALRIAQHLLRREDRHG